MWLIVRRRRICSAIFASIVLSLSCSRAQELYGSHDTVVKGSIQLFGYDKPVRIRVTTGFGSVESPQPFVPAVICVDSIEPGGTLDCFAAKTKKDVYFDDPRVKFIAITDSHEAVLFSANLNYSGSGWTWLWSLLILNRDGLWQNLFPEITSSNQSEHLFWSSPALSSYKVFTVADFIWAEGETHFSAHRYEIKSYEYCPSTSKYFLADDFTTKQKFPGLDDADKLDVIHPMLPEIQRRLRQRAAKACS